MGALVTMDAGQRSLIRCLGCGEMKPVREGLTCCTDCRLKQHEAKRCSELARVQELSAAAANAGDVLGFGRQLYDEGTRKHDRIVFALIAELKSQRDAKTAALDARIAYLERRLVDLSLADDGLNVGKFPKPSGDAA